MAAYVVAELDVTDAEGYAAYGAVAVPTIQQYGGKVLVASNDVQPLEGDWAPKRIVLLEFDTVDQANAWYHSQEYRDPKAMRQRAARTKAVVAAGL